MLSQLRPALVVTIAFTLLAGLVYPLAFTAIAQLVMPSQANGSLVSRNGVVVGSALIGQSFSADRYFHGRPSAAGDKGYDASASSGSNFGPTSQKLIDRVKATVAELRTHGASSIPADAATASASGLDPDISPAFAELQVERVAKARGVSAEQIRQIIGQHTQRPRLGFVGEPRVNVLTLNLALDAAFASGAG
jgi:potassium-transporting ATPase KdpC subunit